MAYIFYRLIDTKSKTVEEITSLISNALGSEFLAMIEFTADNIKAYSYSWDLIKSTNDKGTAYACIPRTELLNISNNSSNRFKILFYNNDGEKLNNQYTIFDNRKELIGNIEYALYPLVHARLGIFPGLYSSPTQLSANELYSINNENYSGFTPASSSYNDVEILYHVLDS